MVTLFGVAFATLSLAGGGAPPSSRAVTVKLCVFRNPDLAASVAPVCQHGNSKLYAVRGS